MKNYLSEEKLVAEQTTSSLFCTRTGILRQPGDLSILCNNFRVSSRTLAGHMSILVTTTKTGTWRAKARPRCSFVIPMIPALAPIWTYIEFVIKQVSIWLKTCLRFVEILISKDVLLFEFNIFCPGKFHFLFLHLNFTVTHKNNFLLISSIHSLPLKSFYNIEYTTKTPKIWTLEKTAVIIFILTVWFYYKVILSKGADEMVNSVDPEQSDLGLHCMSENLGSLRYSPSTWQSLEHVLSYQIL